MAKVWVAVDTGERLEPDNVRRGIYYDSEDAIEDFDALAVAVDATWQVVGLCAASSRAAGASSGASVRTFARPSSAASRDAVSVGPRVGAPRPRSSVGFGQQASGPRGGWFERF